MKYLISLGANIGKRHDNLVRARDELSSCCGKLIRQSAVYETAPWGFDAQDWFLNQVILLESELEPVQLLEDMFNIEAEMGRNRGKTGNYQSRVIDMDILLADRLVINTPDLTVPHPRMHERNFVLVPAAEIAGNWVHPVLGETLKVLRDACPDEEEVRKT